MQQSLIDADQYEAADRKRAIYGERGACSDLAAGRRGMSGQVGR